MAIGRYTFVNKRNNSMGKSIVSNSKASYRIFNAVENQTINYTVKVLEDGERLDILAGIYYEDSSLWWVLAAASGIGWGLQVPPGTIIRVPTNIGQVMSLLS